MNVLNKVNRDIISARNTMLENISYRKKVLLIYTGGIVSLLRSIDWLIFLFKVNSMRDGLYDARISNGNSTCL